MDDLVKSYRMYRKMVQYPHILQDMRRLFLAALSERNIVTAERLRQEVQAQLNEAGKPLSEENIREYTDALIDLYFVRHFDEEQIENYINLARKQDAFQRLNRLVNTEGVTSKAVQQAVEEFGRIPQGSLYLPPSEAEGVRVALISHFISNQLPFIGVAKGHITIDDIKEIMDCSYWNRRRAGKLGGKAAGMFLAYKIVQPQLKATSPELYDRVTIPESFYFNSGILSDFIDYNGLYSFHSQKYKSRDAIEEEYESLAQLLGRASFPADVVGDFRGFLERIGEHPLILRSSSLLEDNFGHAFSGKYDSIFLSNQGDFQQRLNDFIWGFKQVLASTFSPSAILYRRDHNLIDFDERMSVLVQKVVGRRFGDYFFPFASGVAFSHNPYLWSSRIVKEEGFVRLVLGLGTRAVDRTGSDYPRMVPLSHPDLRPEVSAEQIKKYSQKMVDVLNLKTGRIEAVAYRQLFEVSDHPELYYALSVDEEGHLAAPLFRSHEINLDRSCVTFDNFIAKTPFVPLMKRILKALETAYGRPVDVEFAWDNDKLYLLQCRSLAVGEPLGPVTLPRDTPREQILFTNHREVSSGVVQDIEYLVYIDPKAYAQLSTMEERKAIVRAVSRINRALEEKRYALFGPVRWGSNDIKIGVQVRYEDINRTLILAEIAFESKGSTPEISYGTHFFNDLVEARIIPVGIYPDQPGTIFREDFFLNTPNVLTSLVPDMARYASTARVIHVPSCTEGRLLHVFQDGRRQEGMGFFDYAKGNFSVGGI